MNIHFLSGTETGSAEMLCEDLEAEFGGEFSCKVSSLDDVAPTELDGETFYIVVTSTHGSGELPFTAQGFFEKLEAAKPDLSHVRFAIFGMGDRTFGETFNQGSERMMNALLAAKANQVGERGIHDASSSDLPEEVAIPWLRTILSQAGSAAA
ncbi:MAG: flavodoxin domain-containing protein [Pseudomonadota bacterium]